jgi:4-hydroxymandelate oxidase
MKITYYCPDYHLCVSQVFVGRPAIWALAVAGEEGVIRLLELLRQDLDNVMALAGNTV